MNRGGVESNCWWFYLGGVLFEVGQRGMGVGWLNWDEGGDCWFVGRTVRECYSSPVNVPRGRRKCGRRRCSSKCARKEGPAMGKRWLAVPDGTDPGYPFLWPAIYPGYLGESYCSPLEFTVEVSKCQVY